jgi:hypothetical protein
VRTGPPLQGVLLALLGVIVRAAHVFAKANKACTAVHSGRLQLKATRWWCLQRTRTHTLPPLEEIDGASHSHAPRSSALAGEDVTHFILQLRPRQLNAAYV